MIFSQPCRDTVFQKLLHFTFGCFSVCFVQTKLIMLCIIVPMHLYLFPITNHCCIVDLCKAVFTFTSHSLSISTWSTEHTWRQGIVWEKRCRGASDNLVNKTVR